MQIALILYENILYMINFSFYVTWLYANMFGESINKLKLKLNLLPLMSDFSKTNQRP